MVFPLVGNDCESRAIRASLVGLWMKARVALESNFITLARYER
jgi:hypothetical protein